MLRNYSDRLSGKRLSFLAILLSLTIILSLLVTGCNGNGEDEEIEIAAYGSFGSAFAQTLAVGYPDRSPGSDAEWAAGDFIISAFSDMGYEPEITVFTYADKDGYPRQSRNISIRIPGTGFIIENENGEADAGDEVYIERQVIVGAHYDTAIGADLISPEPETEPTEEAPVEETSAETTETDQADTTTETGLIIDPLEPEWKLYNGIHDNASGIGVLMTLAREMVEMELGYDVILVAFGAGEANQAGAEHFSRQMSADQINRTDVMYNIDGIYAGDKVYAHAGWNALREDYLKEYDMRRKLFELTDIFYDHELYSNNGFMLYTNQSVIDLPLPLAEPEQTEPEEPEETVTEETVTEETRLEHPVHLFREWTTHISDYRPFDQLNIPIVFFDSGDYDIKQASDLKESNNPAFSSTDGMIRHTAFDSTDILPLIFDQVRASSIFDEEGNVLPDRLSLRINNTAFLILEAVQKGITELH